MPVHATEYEEFVKSDTEKKNTIQPSTSRSQKTNYSPRRCKLLEIYRLISEMIALQDQSFNFVEGLGFKLLLPFIVFNFQLRGRCIFIECSRGESMKLGLAKKIKELLKLRKSYVQQPFGANQLGMYNY